MTNSFVNVNISGDLYGTLIPIKSVRVINNASNTPIASLIAGLVIDGVTLANGDRVLLASQATGTQNGIYVVTASGGVRSTDMNLGKNGSGKVVFVVEGTSNATTAWAPVNSIATGIIGTNVLAYARVYPYPEPYTAGLNTSLVTSSTISAVLVDIPNTSLTTSALVGSARRYMVFAFVMLTTTTGNVMIEVTLNINGVDQVNVTTMALTNNTLTPQTFFWTGTINGAVTAKMRWRKISGSGAPSTSQRQTMIYFT